MSRAFRIASPCVRPAVLDATWAADGYSIGGNPLITNIAAMGDSLTGGMFLSETATSTMGSYLMGPLYYETGLVPVVSAAGENFQTGGMTVAQIIATHLPQVITASPDLCVVQAGTNSLDDSLVPAAGNGNTDAAAAWIFAQLVTIMTSLRDNGIHCIICTITPDDALTTTANERTVRAKTNDLIRANARTYGAVVCDWAPEISTDPEDDTAPANTLYLRDNVHYNVAGQWRLGLKLRETVVANFRVPGVAEYPASGSASWITSNPYMTGDVSGLATGFSVNTFGTPAPTITRSKTAEGWQRLTITGGTDPGANRYSQINILSTIATDTTWDNRRFKALWDIRPVESGWDFWAIQPRLELVNLDNSSINRNMLGVNAYGSTTLTSEEKTNLDFKSKIDFFSPTGRHPGGTGTQRRQIAQRLRLWGNGTIDIRLMGVVEVT